jgi:hypothetical protein
MATFDDGGQARSSQLCYQYAGEKQGERVLHRLNLYKEHNDAT